MPDAAIGDDELHEAVVGRGGERELPLAPA